jgi:hypothetical protein
LENALALPVIVAVRALVLVVSSMFFEDEREAKDRQANRGGFLKGLQVPAD